MKKPLMEPVIAWAIVCRKDRVPKGSVGLPIISMAKPVHYDRRFARAARVEIREVRG